jgi:hypothetical protein
MLKVEISFCTVCYCHETGVAHTQTPGGKYYLFEHREMIFCAIHMTEKWPHMMTEKRPFLLETDTGDNIFFQLPAFNGSSY